MAYRLMQGVAAAALLLGALGAGLSPNVYTPLTDAVTIGVINATPYRAIFLLGAYDNLDEKTIPMPSGVLLESRANDATGLGTTFLKTATISPNSVSPLTAACRRAISIGSPELVNLVRENLDVYKQANIDLAVDERTLITGVNFSVAALDSPDATNPTEGTADPLTILQGIDYPCGSVVILRLVQDATTVGGFRVVLDGVIF